MAGYTPSHTYWDPVKRMMVTTPGYYAPPPTGVQPVPSLTSPTPAPTGWPAPSGVQYPPPTGGFTGGMNLPALNVPAGLSGTLSSALSGLTSLGGGGTGTTPRGFSTSGYRPPGMTAPSAWFPSTPPSYGSAQRPVDLEKLRENQRLAEEWEQANNPNRAALGSRVPGPPGSNIFGGVVSGYSAMNPYASFLGPNAPRVSYAPGEHARGSQVPGAGSIPAGGGFPSLAGPPSSGGTIGGMSAPTPTQPAPAGYQYVQDPNGTWRLISETGLPPQESQRALLELQAILARQAAAQQGTQQMELARLQAQNERGLTQLGQTGARDLAQLDADTRARLLGREQSFAGEQAGLERTFTGQESAAERTLREALQTRELEFGAGESEKERAGSLAFLQEQARLKGVGGERTIAALKELMQVGVPPPPLGAESLDASLFGGMTSPLTPLGLTPGEPRPMDEASDQAIWGRAKERVGGTLEGALKGLADVASARGIAGSGIEGQMISDVLGRGVGELGEVSREQAIQDLLAKRRADELNQQYLLARRGQDIDVRAQDMARQNALITALLSGNLF